MDTMILNCTILLVFLTLQARAFLVYRPFHQFLHRNHQGGTISFHPRSQIHYGKPSSKFRATIRLELFKWRRKNTTPEIEVKNITLLSPINVTEQNTTSETNATTTTATNIAIARKSKAFKQPSNSFFGRWTYHPHVESSTTLSTAKDTRQLVTPPTPPSFSFGSKTSSDPLTLADLEEILRLNGYVRESDLNSLQQMARPAPNDSSSRIFASRMQPTTTTSTAMTTTSKQAAGGTGKTAFPQFAAMTSILSYRDLTIGSTVSAGILGLVLSISIYPNLWLVGLFLGGIYGNECAKQYAETNSEGSNVVARSIIWCGRKIAKGYLAVFDAFNGFWFLYKTGQLSYEYYKQYSVLDSRYKLTEKMDAWNQRFQEGKRRFDQWERENEVGRKALAAMRTMWLVEEKSLKKGARRIYGKRSSKYRLVQYCYDLLGYMERFFKGLIQVMTGGRSEGLEQLFRGIRVEIASGGFRVGAALTAVISINLLGAIYTLFPWLLTFSAVVVGGVMWPTWPTELFERSRDVVEEIREEGSSTSVLPENTASRTINGDKSKRRLQDGRRRAKRRKNLTSFSLTESLLDIVPWRQRRPRKREPLMEQWGIIGQSVRHNQESLEKKKTKRNKKARRKR